MDKIASTVSILELVPEDLVVATQLEPATQVMGIKVYEREHFFDNPNPSDNLAQIDHYSVRLGSLDHTVAKKAISFYSFKKPYAFIHAKRHLSLR